MAKAFAAVLCVSLMVPPQFGVAAELARTRSMRGGVNSVNSLIATSLPSFFSLTPLNFSALLPIPCPPDVPTMTLPNGDANRDGIIDDADYDLVDTNRGVPDPDPRADLNGDGGSKTTI